jgi:hypothetical protein
MSPATIFACRSASGAQTPFAATISSDVRWDLKRELRSCAKPSVVCEEHRPLQSAGGHKRRVQKSSVFARLILA